MTSPTLVAAVTTLSSYCTTLLASSSLPSLSTLSLDPPPITDIRNDTLQLITLLAKECTSLSLAFKPPVSIAAAEGVVGNMNALLLKLALVESLARDRTGSLPKEINWAIAESVEAVQRLLDGSLACFLQVDKSRVKEMRDINLRLTGQVWEKAEQAKGMSGSELEACRKGWKSILGLVDDCLEEVKEMELSKAGGEDDEEEEDEDEDDEDDFRTSNPLSDVERERVGASYMLLRLGRLLLQRLITSTTPLDVDSPYALPSFLTTSQRLVKQLSASADDFSGELEPPQSDVEIQADEFVEGAEELSKAIEEVVGAVEGTGSAEEKWQQMWREQISKARAKLRSIGTEPVAVA